MASRNASFHERGIAGALFAPVKWVFGGLLVLLALILAAWIIDWIFVFKVWPEGIDQLKSILAADLAHAQEFAAQQGVASGAITSTANFLYGVVFRATGFHDMGMRFAEGTAMSIPDTIARNTYVANRDAIEVAMIGTQLLGVRLATLALILPLLVLVYAVAVADGLTQRAIRRAAGGRESASLYHRAKHMQVAAVATAVMTVLVLPAPVDWLLVGMPLVTVVSILARLQWAYYKKHL